MSLILDALNRADRENRKPESSPNLETEHLQPDTEDDKPSRTFLYTVIAIFSVLLSAGLGYIFLLSDVSTPLSPTSTSQPGNPQVSNGRQSPSQTKELQASNKTVTSHKIQRNHEPTTSLQNTNKSTKKSEVLRQQFIDAQYERQKALAATQDTTPAAQKKQNNEPKDQKQITGLYEQPKVQKAMPSTPVPVQKPIEVRPTPRPKRTFIVELMDDTSSTPPSQQTSTVKESTPERDATDEEFAYYKNIGSIRDLPFKAQNAIPTIMYTTHDYDNKKITINGRSYKERSSVSSGLTLKKILKDGVIFKYKKYTFKMRAYNNWINT